jgi:hypothetical protein
MDTGAVIDILTCGMQLPGTLISKWVAVPSRDPDRNFEALAKIREMGVGSVCTWGKQKLPVPRQEAHAGLDQRLRRVEHFPVMSMLKQLLKEHLERLHDGYEGTQE